MATRIQIRRGEGLPPNDLVIGELAYDTLNDKLYIGTGVTPPNHYQEIGSFDTLQEFGITATAAEINVLDESTATTNDLNQLNNYASKLVFLANINTDLVTLLGTKAPLVHAHGNITNDGTISTIATIGTGDRLIISDTGTIAQSSIAFGPGNGFLREDGTWATPSDTTTLSGLGITSTVTELNYTDGVTSNIQTQLNLKANLASPALTGTPIAPTATEITNTTQLATTQFVHTAIANVNGYTPALTEWVLVEKFVLSGGTISINNSTFTNDGYDILNYDYKFVVDLDTTIEDNSSPYIRINNISTNSYNYVYERVSLDAISNPGTGQSTSFGGHDQNLINTGLLLGSASADVGITNLHLEFTVSQSYGFFTFGNNFHSIFVEGKGSALAIDAPAGTPIIFPIMSKFAGNISQSSGLSQVDIIHDITAGSVDNSVVRVYRRPK
jgi:hypothetical protein